MAHEEQPPPPTTPLPGALLLCVHANTLQEELAGLVVERTGTKVFYCVSDSRPSADLIHATLREHAVIPPPLVVFLNERNVAADYEGPNETHASALAFLKHYGLTLGPFNGFTRANTQAALAFASIKTLPSREARRETFLQCFASACIFGAHADTGLVLQTKERSLAALVASNSILFAQCAVATVGGSAGINAVHEALSARHKGVCMTLVNYVRATDNNHLVQKWSVRAHNTSAEALGHVMDELLECAGDYGLSQQCMASASPAQAHYHQATGTGQIDVSQLISKLREQQQQ